MVTDKYSLIDNETGEITRLTVFESNNKYTWEKVFARSLCDMLNVFGNERVQVITYLIKNKNYENKVTGTMRSISKELGISKTTVNRTMKLLQDNNCIIRLGNGMWMFSPHIMVIGNRGYSAAVLRRWQDGQ